MNALGGLIGSELGDAYGLGGLGLTGSGLGSIGNLGTIGKSVGGGAPAGTQRGPQILAGTVQVRGSLAKGIIRRVIRGHLRELQYCYEVQLQRHPQLAGRVVVGFTIEPDGSVAGERVQSSTLGNNHVEQCVVGAMGRWRFPAVPDGGVVTVTYPFVFAASGRPPTPATPKLATPARVAVARKAADPPNEWDLALAIVRDDTKPVAWRVTRAAEILGAPATDWPKVLGWWIVQSRLRPSIWPPEAHLVAAYLLRLGGDTRDAVRLLTEVAPRDPPRVVAELRRVGATADASRLTVLDARALLHR